VIILNFIKTTLQSIIHWFKDLFSIEEHNVSAILMVFVFTWFIVLICEYVFDHPLSQTLATCLNYLTGGAIGVGGANVTGNAVNTFQKIKSDIASVNIGNLVNDLTNNNTTSVQTTVPTVTTENTTSSTVTSGSINTNV
jgi:hypothetical protein